MLAAALCRRGGLELDGLPGLVCCWGICAGWGFGGAELVGGNGGVNFVLLGADALGDGPEVADADGEVEFPAVLEDVLAEGLDGPADELGDFHAVGFCGCLQPVTIRALEAEGEGGGVGGGLLSHGGKFIVRQNKSNFCLTQGYSFLFCVTMNDETVSVTIKLPQDLVEFIDSVAVDQCNKRSGIVRLALTNFRKATQAAEEAQAQQEAPEASTAA